MGAEDSISADSDDPGWRAMQLNQTSEVCDGDIVVSECGTHQGRNYDFWPSCAKLKMLWYNSAASNQALKCIFVWHALS